MPTPLQALLNKGEILNNRYEIQELVKAGGMGCVYKVWDQRLEKNWALKILNLAQFSSQEQGEMIVLFEREAKILSNLRHTGIPLIIDYFLEKNSYCFIMDFISGKNLEEILKQGKLDVEKVVQWGIELCKILDFLHSQNPPVLYRDMKPSNIILTDEEKIILVDFGVAGWLRVKAAQQPGTIAFMGSPGFAPPEQYIGKTDEHSDIYGLGATLHFLLSGIDPSENPFIFSSLYKIRSDVSNHLDEIIIKAVETTPERRFSTATELRQALENVLTPSLVIGTKTQSTVQPSAIYKQDSKTKKTLEDIAKSGFSSRKTFSTLSSADRTHSFSRLTNYFKVGLLDEAIRETTEIIQMLRNSTFDEDLKSTADFLFLASQMYEQKGQINEAIDCLKETIKLNPYNPVLYENLMRLNKQIINKQTNVQKQQAALKYRQTIWSDFINWLNTQLHPKHIANSIYGDQWYICDLAIAIGMICGFCYWQIFNQTPLARFDGMGIYGTFLACLSFIIFVLGIQLFLFGFKPGNNNYKNPGLILMLFFLIITSKLILGNINYYGSTSPDSSSNIVWGSRAEKVIQLLPLETLKNLASSQGIKKMYTENLIEIKICDKQIDLFKFPEILKALEEKSHDLQIIDHNIRQHNKSKQKTKKSGNENSRKNHQHFSNYPI